MEYNILGRSGLKVSVVGLGCGGPSRLGQRANKSEKESVSLVRQALDMGINILDTAEVYGTESIVGRAVRDVPRDQVVISTKRFPPSPNTTNPDGELRRGLEQSLRKLRTDYVDIYHLHGITPEQYPYSLNTLAPALVKLREEGKIRCLGITEAFVPDSGHQMLHRAVDDGCWDVVMVGFNMLNQTARNLVFPKTLEKGIGVLVMFALRKALSRPSRLKQVVTELKQKGLVPSSCNAESPLEFLTRDGKASTIPDADYRYCRHEPGTHVILTGTGNPEHLRANVESLLKPPLPEEDLLQLRGIFGRVNCITGD
ncbi:MAG: aldo/keto reductase [Candidatus Binatia bacterium]